MSTTGRVLAGEARTTVRWDPRRDRSCVISSTSCSAFHLRSVESGRLDGKLAGKLGVITDGVKLAGGKGRPTDGSSIARRDERDERFDLGTVRVLKFEPCCSEALSGGDGASEERHPTGATTLTTWPVLDRTSGSIPTIVEEKS